MKPITGYIYDAYKGPMDERGHYVIFGHVFGDKMQRFTDGDLIRTSRVTGEIEGRDYAADVTTLNSVYRIINWKEV